MARRMRNAARIASLAAIAAALLGLCVSPTVAAGATRAEECASTGCAWWKLETAPAPTHLAPGAKEDLVLAFARNQGDVQIDGSTHEIVVSDKLPAGLRPISMVGIVAAAGNVICPSAEELKNGAPLRCTFAGKLGPYQYIQLRIVVEVEPAVTAAELPNEVTVEGGAEASGAEVPAPPALVKNFRIDSSPTPFGIEELSSEAERDDGSTDRQAGEHPFALTTTLNFNSDLEAVSNGSEPVTPTTTKDVQVELPPGLIGNPVPFEGQQCSEFDLLHPPPLSITNECPDNSAVGVATLTINEPTFGYFTGTVPVFNLQHGPGEPARLGFALLHAAVVLPTH